LGVAAWAGGILAGGEARGAGAAAKLVPVASPAAADLPRLGGPAVVEAVADPRASPLDGGRRIAPARARVEGVGHGGQARVPAVDQVRRGGTQVDRLGVAAAEAALRGHVAGRGPRTHPGLCTCHGSENRK